MSGRPGGSACTEIEGGDLCPRNGWGGGHRGQGGGSVGKAGGLNIFCGAEIHTMRREGQHEGRKNIAKKRMTGPRILSLDQAKERSTNPNFWVRISSAREWRSSTSRGGGLKGLVCPLKPRKTKLFGATSRDFCRDFPGVARKV